MRSTKRIHVAYIVTILALLSLGATYAARSMMVEIGPTATITGTFPEIQFLDTDAGDPDWEIEALNAGESGNVASLSISPDGSTGAGIFRIVDGSDENQLVLDQNGNIAINGVVAQTFHELEVFGNSGSSDDFGAIALTPGGSPGFSTRISNSDVVNNMAIGVREGGTSYTVPVLIDLGAPDFSLAIDADGDVGIGVSEDNVAAGFNLHVARDGKVKLDPSGTVGDWSLEPSAGTGLNFVNEGITPVRFLNGAPLNSLVVDGLGNIGAGTPMPDQGLHIFRTNGQARLTVEEQVGVVANRQLATLQNNGGVFFSLENTALMRRWDFSNSAVGNFQISLTGTGGSEVKVDTNGTFTVGPGGFAAMRCLPNGNVTIAGALTQGSDRNKKENFQEVDCEAVLAKVAELPVTTWNYKTDDDTIRHIGPMAQDFRAAFELGHDDVTITTLDTDGVALASIKALNTKLEAKEAKIEQLEQRLQTMERAVLQLMGQ